MVTDRSTPPPAGANEEGWARLELESERLRSRRRELARWTGAFLLVAALNGGFVLLFLPKAGATRTTVSGETAVFVLATVAAHLAASALMRRWSTSATGSVGGFAVAAIAAGLVGAAAASWTFRALDTADAGRGVLWWLGRPGRVPPAVGADAVAAFRPGLVVLLLLVLPPVAAAVDAILARRDRLHLDRLADEVRLAATRSARPAWSANAVAEPPTSSFEPQPLAGEAPPSAVRVVRAPDPDTSTPALPPRRLMSPTRPHRRSRARYGAMIWTVLLVALTVFVVALPHAGGYWRSNIASTVFQLAAGSSVVATLVLHGWCRTSSASLRGLAVALVSAVVIATSGWWLTLSVIGGLRLRPEGLGYLRDPALMADLDALYDPPLLVAHGSWQQAAVLALPFVVPVVLAAWDVLTRRRDDGRTRGPEYLRP